MAKAERPFLIVNPKSYLYGQKSLELAMAADKTAAETGLQIYFTCPYADIRLIKANTSHVIVCAQSLDPLKPGRGMGHVLPESLKEAGAEEKLEKVLEEVPRVRKDFGYPPLVTPTSQIVGSQAVLNVLMGRYATFTKESRGLLGGEYGELPGTVNEEVRKKAIGESEPITCRPADLLEPELERIKQQYSDIAKTEEDVLSCAMFPQVAPEFIRRRDDLLVHEIEVEWV